MVKCEICKKEFKVITITHLKRHGIATMKEYRAKYPNAKLVYGERDTAVNTLGFWVKKYGSVDGKERYEKYKKRMGYTNTYEYKREKYGWSKEEFNEYNLSRAVTLKNMVKKYGDELGKEKYKQYREIQRNAGCTEKYFVNKYGYEKGLKIYKEINLKKAQTLHNFILRYGEEDGPTEYYDYMQRRTNNYGFSSNNEMKFCDMLIESMKLSNIVVDKIYYYATKQFGQWVHANGNISFYDIVIPELKLCIEYNGDYWHCNPKMYNSDFFHPHLEKTAKDIWEREKNKLETIEGMGYHTIIIWENEYLNDKDKTIEEIIRCMKTHMN